MTITAQEILVDNASYPTPKIEQNSHLLPPARPGLREPGRAADEPRPGVRLRRGPGLRGRADRDHDRRGLSPVGDHRARPRRPVRRVREERAAVPARNREAPRRRVRDPRCRHAPTEIDRGGTDVLGRRARTGHAARLPQRPGDRARADRHDRLHDGLRYHRHRARHRAHQVQEARRRGLPQDRQQDRPGGAQEARLLRRPGRGDRQVHRRARDDRGRAGPQAGAPARLRLRLQAGQRRALHPLHGPRPDDGRDPAVPQWRDQQDREHARGGHGRGDRARSTSRAGSWASRPSRSIATAPSARSRCPRARRRTRATAEDKATIDSLTKQLEKLRSRSRSRTGGACRTSGRPSRTSSRSLATRATSPSACIRTASRARSS